MLAADQRETFWQLGFLPLGRVTGPPGVDRLNAALDRIIDPSGPTSLPADHLIRAASDGHVRVGLHLCHLDDTFRAFATDPAIASSMRDILGCDVVVLTSLLFNKPQGSGQPLAPHQDLPYYRYLGDADLITCWTALDPVGLDNGPVEYLAGSHRVRQPHRSTGSQQALDIADDLVDLSASVPVPLGAGEAVAHHGLTVHRSAANTSGRRRRGIATLYIRADTRVRTVDFPYLPLVPDIGPSRWRP